MGRTYVRCEKCGSEFRSMEWREGLKCPGCQSDQLTPVEYEDEDENGSPAAPAPAVGTPSAADIDERERVTWKKSPVVGVIAIAIILFGVIRLGAWKRGPGIVKYTDPYQCAKCGYTTEISMDAGVNPPIKCNSCGEEALCRQYRCGKCEFRFAWNAPKRPQELDEASLPQNEEERNKILSEHNAKLEASEGFFMKCPQCQSDNVFEEWTSSHKAAIQKHGKDLPEVTKKNLNEKYGIKF